MATRLPRAVAPGRRARRATYLVCTVAGSLLSVMGVWQASGAGFSGTTSTPTNTFGAGSVAVSTNSPGTAVFAANDVAPDNGPRDRCVVVTYTGTAQASVRVYGSDLTGDIGTYLSFEITEGSGTDGGCSDFTAAGGAVYSGTLQDFGTTRTSYASGVGTFAPGTNGQTRTYRIRYAVQDTPEAQERAGTIRLTWEAQS